jgi:hypothetical protein
VAGVNPTTADQPPLASWAAGGRATVRPFAQEPYINGPDGFGTGQPDGMLVLMADGSVKFLLRETDPSVLRRMAAMADGLPLDPAVPGEPSAHGLNPPPLAGVPPVPPVPAEDVAVQPGDDRPIDVPLAPDPPRIDIAAALGQRIASIEQSEPVPASALLQQVAEMAGVTIDARAVIEDKSLAGRLNTPVTLRLTQTTVRDMLEAVLQQVGLKYEAGEFGVRVLAVEVDTP